MVIKKGQFKVPNKIDYDIIHFETEASQVFANDGEDLESKISHYVKKEDLAITKITKVSVLQSENLVPIPGTGQSIYKTYKVNSELDDGYVSINGIDNTSTELKYALNPKINAFFRINNIDIPQGSYIFGSEFKYYGKLNNGIYSSAEFSEEDNATIPTTLEEFESKTWTENDNFRYNYYYDNYWCYNYNLQKFVDKIISRPGWESGNSMLILIAPKYVNNTDGVIGEINSYKLGSHYAAELKITYEDANTRSMGVSDTSIPFPDFNKAKDTLELFTKKYNVEFFNIDINEKTYTISDDSKYIHFNKAMPQGTEIKFEMTRVKGGDNSGN